MPNSFTFQELKNLLPKRQRNSHKGDFGRVLICAGSCGMGGAGILASEASLFCGSGLVSLATDISNVKASLVRNPEVMTTGIDMNNEIDFEINIKNQDVILYGPGISRNLTTEAILIKILSGSEKSKLIFDAGALHIMSSMAPLKNKIDQSIL